MTSPTKLSITGQVEGGLNPQVGEVFYVSDTDGTISKLSPWAAFNGDASAKNLYTLKQ